MTKLKLFMRRNPVLTCSVPGFPLLTCEIALIELLFSQDRNA